ncbi:hypothetical protein, partial [Rhodoblastus acidophilus]|uniref:hypothetical protein n=1 Tax=Rhodoblastus acidophilus TaxID=1074 RepID=UPI00222449F2
MSIFNASQIGIICLGGLGVNDPPIGIFVAAIREWEKFLPRVMVSNTRDKGAGKSLPRICDVCQFPKRNRHPAKDNCASPWYRLKDLTRSLAGLPGFQREAQRLSEANLDVLPEFGKYGLEWGSVG